MHAIGSRGAPKQDGNRNATIERWGERMIRGFCWGLFVAAVLAYFLHVDTLLINLAQPYLPHVTLTSAYYYVIFGLIGMVSKIFK